MSKRLEDGIWVVVCDWEDPETGKPCDLGFEGAAAMFVDPDGGRNPELHFQCGRHHGIVKQEEKPEFQLPEGHKLNQEVVSRDADDVEVEEVEDDGE